MRDDSDHDFKGHEPDDQHERDSQVASIRIATESMRVAEATIVFVAVVMVISGAVVRGVLRRHHNLNLRNYLTRYSPITDKTMPIARESVGRSPKPMIPAAAISAAPPARIAGTADSGPPR